MIESTLKYEFSLTGSSLRVNDMVLFASKYVNEGVAEFKSDKGTTNKRMVSEFKKRIDNLTHDQQLLFIDGDSIIIRNDYISNYISFFTHFCISNINCRPYWYIFRYLH